MKQKIEKKNTYKLKKNTCTKREGRYDARSHRVVF